ncbi:MAG: amidase family protein, partial [Phycisphaerales bacterium]|nr:amidase family protein [Phycisphaerales bacterium]
ERIGEVDPAINAFHEIWQDHAIARAEGIDLAVAAGDDPGVLAGVPIAIKDNIATSHGTTTCGSRMLEHYKSPFDATVVERLEAAGAILIGKTNCDEFAMGSSTEHCAWGATRNPWDPSRVPGGSSGGSAAAVSANLCCGALGSDTGGSIRQPAALCGIVGFKPSYGMVSRFGLVAFASSLDQVGPFASSVDDAAMMMQAIAGFDEKDSTSSDCETPNFTAELDQPVSELRIGIPPQFLDERNEPAVTQAGSNAIDTFRSLGATIVDIDL